jgi:hypothetical protein
MSLVRTVAFLTAITFAGAGAAAAQVAGPKAAPRMPHPAAGHAECLGCHGAGANAHVVSVPASHHYAVAACAACHHPADTLPTPVPHALDAMHATCRMCHVANSPMKGASAPPASHAAYDAATCQMCHTASQPSGAAHNSHTP